MNLVARGVISVLAGIGGGAIGYLAMTHAIEASPSSFASVGQTNSLIVSIFAPFILVTLAIYWYLSAIPVRSNA